MQCSAWNQILTVSTFGVKCSHSFLDDFLLLYGKSNGKKKRWGERRKKQRKMKRYIERFKGQRRAQVTQLSPWKQNEGSCGFEPPKVLLEHRLFNRREKQCYSCFLHHWVFPTSKHNRDWVIMLWSGIRWIQRFFVVFFFSPFLASQTPPLLFFCSFPCGGIGSSVKEISVISLVIAHSLAPSAMLALKHTLCVSGHGGCSPSLLLPFHSLFLSVSLLLLNATYYFPTRQAGGNSDVKERTYLLTVSSVCSLIGCVFARAHVCE